MNIGGTQSALLGLAGLGFLASSRTLRRDDGIDASKLNYSKPERLRRKLWLSVSNVGLVLILVGGTLGIVFVVPRGFRAMTPVQWSEIGVAFLIGMLLVGVSERVLIALALTAAQREGRNATA